MRPVLALLAAVCLAAATPPGWFPGAGLAVLPGLAAFYALATSSRRPYSMAFCVGLAHMLAFSWSLRHVFWGGYVAVGILGAVYYLGAVAWTRVLRRWIPGGIAFGFGLAASQWLRAEMPGIGYPHGQAVHCLYAWPQLMGPVRWGGEVFANALLAATRRCWWTSGVRGVVRARRGAARDVTRWRCSVCWC